MASKKSRKAREHEDELVAKSSSDEAEKAAKLAAKLEKAQEQVADSVAAAPQRVADLLAVGEGFRLADVDTRSTPGFDGKKADGKAALAAGAALMSDLQERLWAASRSGDTRSVLLVVQAMDTAGKGGIMRHVVGAVDPQGVRHTAFKAPTPEERSHDFLWRIRRALPQAGEIGVFDRSHYEDVLVVRVHDLVPRATWQRRYAAINRFEKALVDKGTTVVKVMLHISKDEQKERLAERLDRPDKHWKYNPGDVDERGHWDAYQEAYQVALTRCSTQAAPWYVVPADRKWYARWAVQQLLTDALSDLDPRWPEADFDVEAEKKRLAES
ncbi:polyphosphate kinase 2 family protein [Kineosporia sp. R_H_3]|uniref:polyphosphate kinase 2 family protein n=1 Tax=Kineosporia sp. R_H_3 TaxID=1961848 RepID=UPI000B4A580B|nr:polyphosphate kinase 2 family protein [Kineosporia sp. R_H_3]